MPSEYLYESASKQPWSVHRMMFACVFVVALVARLHNTDRCHAEALDIETVQEEIFKTIDRVRPAVVSLSGGGTSFSGVIVSAQGHVLSAGHAVEPGTRYRITLTDGRRLRGIGKGSNTRNDCALVMISEPIGNLPFVPMGISSELVVNQPCLSLSFPGGQKAGVEPVARFGRLVQTNRYGRFLQSTALMEPGDSGGGLFDLNGNLIGIHSRITQSMQRNYEVPIDVFREFWNELNQEDFFEEAGPPRPRLGVQVPRRGNQEGVRILRVVDKSIAAINGIEAGDVLQTVHGRDVTNQMNLREALIAARDDGSESIEVRLLRSEGETQETIDLTIPFDVQREGAPAVPLPEYKDQRLAPTVGYLALADLPEQFADLESKLDDACLEITSTFGDEDTLAVVGTMIQNTRLVISKSSRIGKAPNAELDGKTISLEILHRDATNDLVILQTPDALSRGILLDAGAEPSLPTGRFLIAPDANGDGLVSIVSSRSFLSRKQFSRGYLGVVPTTYKANEGAVLADVINDGAAKRAGLQIGDVITRLNDRDIKTQQALRQFLSSVDPNVTVTATVLRDEDELIKSIMLDAFPSLSNHAANQMDKSGRRDGFESVIPHDADLQPEDCGGPLFDLQGRFVGLNIARNSRVRSYALPAKIISKLVDDNIQ